MAIFTSATRFVGPSARAPLNVVAIDWFTVRVTSAVPLLVIVPFKPLKLRMVGLKAARSTVPALAVRPPVPRAAELPNWSVPPLTYVLPPKELLLAAIVTTPLPSCASVPVPLIAPEKVWLPKRSKTRAPLFATAPWIEPSWPLAPPPNWSVPPLIVVPPL